MEIIGIKTSIFQENENLLKFLLFNIPPLQSGDILAITSKVVALSQGRTGALKDKEKLIKRESKKTIQTQWALLALTGDGWNINAGIDESNAKKNLILMPKNPFQVARIIQNKLKKHFSIKNLGVLITDTKSVPLRVGTVGRAVAYAGFRPLKSYIGKKDLFGRKSRLTESNIADALAASAVLMMGEGNEKVPVVILRGAPVNFGNSRRVKLSLDPKKDIYFSALKNQN